MSRFEPNCRFSFVARSHGRLMTGRQKPQRNKKDNWHYRVLVPTRRTHFASNSHHSKVSAVGATATVFQIESCSLLQANNRLKSQEKTRQP